MPDTLKNYLWVAFGSALGGVSRFWVSAVVTSRINSLLPWDILLINVTGSLVIGLLAALTSAGGPLLHLRPFVNAFFMIGVCGGYTTFSSFSLHTLRLARDGQWLYAGGNIVASVIFCLMAVWLGFVLGNKLFLPK